MVQQFKMQLNTPPEINRDLQVELTADATGKKVTTQPFLDGTVKANNVDAGTYRVVIRHPNLPSPVYDNRIRVFPDRPTFVPIQIPTDIFSNTPIAQTTEADLGPTRDKLAAAATDADNQGKKKGGQPIYADDWNALSGVIGDVARTTSDLTQRVAPLGHAHPELVAKLNEIQDNLNRFFDVFGKTVVQLERQIQQLALQQRIDAAFAQIVPSNGADTTRLKGIQSDLQTAVAALGDVRDGTPYAYTSQLKRVGAQITSALSDAVPDTPAVRNNADVQAATKTAFSMSSQAPALTYDAELAFHQKVDRDGGAPAASIALGKR